MNDQQQVKELELVISNFPTKESPGTDGITGEFYQMLKGELIAILNPSKKLKRMEHFQAEFIRAVLP